MDPLFSIAIKDTFYKDRKCSPAIAVFLEGKNHFAPVGVQNKKTILIINYYMFFKVSKI